MARRVRTADAMVRDFLFYVLGDNKWNNLKYVNTRRGSGSDAYLIPYTHRGSTHYFSEKNFSLGELCALRMAKSLLSVCDNGLILIDEIEMALHPQAQVRLLEKIKEIARDKNLTVIFSTHSSTLIKNHDRKKIIFLKEEEPGEYCGARDVFPAQVLGEIAFDDELGVDFIFFTEDEQAQYLLKQMIGMFLENRNENRFNPLYKIVPVGGYPQVLKLLGTSSQIFPQFVKRFAFLDDDVRTESLPILRRQRHDLLELFDSNDRDIKYLPCTPEVGLMNLIEADNGEKIREHLSQHLNGHRVQSQRIVQSSDYQALCKEKPREKAKDRVRHFVKAVKRVTGESEEAIYKALYRIYCETTFEAGELANLKRLLAPVFNS